MQGGHKKYNCYNAAYVTWPRVGWFDLVTEKASMEEEGVDALDAFMLSIKSGGMDSRTRMELKRRGVELRQQRAQLQRLVAVAKPCSLPPLDDRSLICALCLRSLRCFSK